MVGRVHLLIMNILSLCSKALSIGTKFFVVFFFLCWIGFCDLWACTHQFMALCYHKWLDGFQPIQFPGKTASTLIGKCCFNIVYVWWPLTVTT